VTGWGAAQASPLGPITGEHHYDPLFVTLSSSQPLTSEIFSLDEEVHREMKTPAIILIVIGIVIVIWGAFGFQTREKVVDVGPIHASKDTRHYVPYGALAGALIAVGGVALLVKSR
jgi:drug/metabolite transporter (DMT)-like permease